MSQPSQNNSWDLSSLEKPWRDRPSLYAYIEQRLRPGDAGLENSQESLPDEEVWVGGGRRWAAGAMDGVLSRHTGGREDRENRANELYRAFKAFLADPSQANLDQFYRFANARHVVGAIDPLLKLIVTDESLPARRFTEFSEWLVRNSADRSPVKIGIALLGLISGDEYHLLFMTIGSHEEFTLYAAVALSYEDDASTRAKLFNLAKRVHGWGRTHVVERLRSTDDPEIKAWLEQEGLDGSSESEQRPSNSE